VAAKYATPQPCAVVQKASVWVLGYPGAVITSPDQSVIGTWADPALWKALDEIGIKLLHTGPVKRSGGIVRKEYTPTVDGWFDRISLEIDLVLGTEADYRRMVAAARKAGGLIAGDLVPLHTGKGADFLLALRSPTGPSSTASAERRRTRSTRKAVCRSSSKAGLERRSSSGSRLCSSWPGGRRHRWSSASRQGGRPRHRQWPGVSGVAI
jgi:hypothetical protein